jgi:multiple sugar transport system permease protein
VSRRARRWRGRGGVRLGLAVFTVWTLGPIAWAVLSSLLPTQALIQSPPALGLSNFALANFVDVLGSGNGLLRGLTNSAIVATATAAVSLVLGSAAAYGLARLGVPGSNRLLLMILATQMFPGIVIIIPLFIVMSRLHLVDTYQGLVAVYLSFILPIVIWVLKGFFEAIPPELERASAVDGATPFQAFWMIVLPISLPPLFATGVFAFIEAWNEFFFAIILTRINVKTAPIMIAEFSGQYQTQYGQMVAAAVLASIPVVVLAIVFRAYILKGFAEGAVKG